MSRSLFDGQRRLSSPIHSHSDPNTLYYFSTLLLLSISPFEISTFLHHFTSSRYFRVKRQAVRAKIFCFVTTPSSLFLSLYSWLPSSPLPLSNLELGLVNNRSRNTLQSQRSTSEMERRSKSTVSSSTPPKRSQPAFSPSSVSQLKLLRLRKKARPSVSTTSSYLLHSICFTEITSLSFSFQSCFSKNANSTLLSSTASLSDHVYISAPWAPGAGEPYLIARVMEFVTASSARAGAAALASSSGTLQVRANLYLRVRDVSHRVTNDPRLLLATMHSDLFALDNVRGLCEVRHRELIGDGSAPDITAWKRRDDHFYFHQLYDRYIHRFYDVIPMSKIKNAPADVLLALNARYSFVVAEVGMAADLCDALRGCAVCHQWAPS